ncbi:hypothetical protein [Facklamia miroungae]|uniref:YolD-like protein n=1 Tax=Facklamia miroungae TaxID=120956 RepID=A0A1G7TX56_9LACT|nr:hypothetical protein [Facklamia miroungae]NKZ30009.1 hypothetical protein [Facklamia miroungae]SDG39856.1 hypothetical protein SAMN05421791_10776 [Facklamia miroungae]
MSVDRSYLSSKAARCYQDRKMAKWMGFFLSEHTSALSHSSAAFDQTRLSPKEKFLLLSQAYVQKLSINLVYQIKNQTKSIHSFTGLLKELSFEQCAVENPLSKDYRILTFDQILDITLAEEVE